MKRLVALLSLVVAFAVGWWLLRGQRAPAPVDVSPPAAAREGAVIDAPPAAADVPDVVREPSTVAATVTPTFVSESDEDGVATDPVRDGIVVLVIGHDRLPRKDLPIVVRWRKGWGLYGNDRGVTDADGRFATTVAEAEMIEGVTVADPELGELGSWFGFLPTIQDARTVLCVVPALQPLTVRVVDQRGSLVPSASVTCEGDDSRLVPREHRLVPDLQDAVATDAGQLCLWLPVGTHVLTAAAENYDSLYKLTVALPVGGRTVTMHLFDHRDYHEVSVTVLGPPEVLQKTRVEGYTRELPPLPGLEAEGVDPQQRAFEAHADGPGRFRLNAPLCAWRCYASADGWQGSTAVTATETAVNVQLQQLPTRKVAQLRCRLQLPDGTDTFGEVMVHTTPDLWRGSRYQISPRSPIIEVPPGGRACVSAWRYRFPPVVVGPIELREGEQEVLLRFGEPSAIRGHVVDERGDPVKATVSLLRPAGPLRELAADVPEILTIPATGDQLLTQDDGAFHFDDLAAGEYGLSVLPARTGWPARARATAGDQNVVVKLGTGIDDLARISGRVTMDDTGAPVVAELHWRGESWSRDVYSDTDGRYALAVEPGPMELTANARRCAWYVGDPMSFPRGLHSHDIVLSSSEPLFVRVRDQDGGVPKVEITAFDERGRQLEFVRHDGLRDSDSVEVDHNGRAELGGLPFATVRLRLQVIGGDAAMAVEVQAWVRRDVDFEVVWKPER